MTKLKHTFKTDILFKMLFVKYPNLLKKLISELLRIKLESIEKFEIRNPDMLPEVIGDKFCRLDINMEVDGQRVDLEVQVEDEGDYIERSMYYWAREFSSALASGTDGYGSLPRTIIISIIDFIQFDCEEFFSEFQPLEVTRHTLMSNKMGFIFFELPKLPAEISRKNMLQVWLRLFKANTEEELAEIEKWEVPEMQQAINAYREVTVSPEFRELVRMQEKARLDERQALHHARKVARAEGMAEVAKNLLRRNRPLNEIMEDTGLTQAEIESLRTSN
ncbi:MAG: Rpn family recombination-promoting nuclease/putative transposase [Oscillospiraceae bacterium]|nr:Rpn family recombination-promoting nuclease/putative transposase [Oscillospiraceae bacterium]